MDATELGPLLEDLEESIDSLEEALAPIVNSDLSAISARLPLLDKAKLHALITYAIESILYSYLNLNGVNAKDHPVFTELSRVKQYFAKLSKVEGAGHRNQALDVPAARRFIKHALAPNSIMDEEQKQKDLRPNAHIKFDQASESVDALQNLSHVARVQAVKPGSAPSNTTSENDMTSSFDDEQASKRRRTGHTRPSGRPHAEERSLERRKKTKNRKTNS